VAGSLFPGLILAGTLVYARRRVPSWLLPGAFLFGVVRAGLAASGFFVFARSLSLALEPALVLIAAWIALGVTRGGLVSIPQRLLPGALVLLALVEAASAVSEIRLGEVTTGIVFVWCATGPLILGIQVLAVSTRERHELLRERDELERRVVEQTADLRESEERFRRLAAMTLEGIALHERGRIREVNSALCEMLDRGRHELIGSNLERMLAFDDPRQLVDLMRARIQGSCEARAIRADGSVLPVEVETREVRYHGRVLQVCAVRDIRERQEAERQRKDFEQQLQEMQKFESLGVLASSIAHDFNNLLTVILGNSRLELAEVPPDSPRCTRIERIRNAGEHAAGLVKQMLTFSERSSVSFATLDLSQLVVEMLDLLRASVSEKCTLQPDLDAELPMASGDASQLRQVILNLVMNASEALGGDVGEIAVRTGTVDADRSYLGDTFGVTDLPAGRYVFVEVSDTGIGIDAETKARIFEPFFTTKFSGRGIGLASVLGIVRKHGGTIKVDSRPGAGSSFQVLLPCVRPAAVRPEVFPAETIETEGLLVLVIDDEEAVVEVTEAFLTRAGYRVLTATAGRAGLALFRAHQTEIGAVILDAAMPDADGGEVCREISSRRPDVPVIVVTGHSPEMLRQRFDISGTAGFVQKPYEIAELLEALRAALA
jgi:two-component system cell cycle sensor histidine kinase/response regulator CckA